MIVNQRKHFDPVKREMNEKDWHLSHSAKKLIDENLHTQYTTKEISIKIGMNEYKLKKLFPRITGFTLEEYRKYKLCVKVGRQIIEQPDEPLKIFTQKQDSATTRISAGDFSVIAVASLPNCAVRSGT